MGAAATGSSRVCFFEGTFKRENNHDVVKLEPGYTLLTKRNVCVRTFFASPLSTL
jgi:hypothetical protein